MLSPFPRLCLFEDHAVANLEPLTLTRPVFDLLCGVTSLRDTQRRLLPDAPLGVLVRPALARLYRQMHPDLVVNDPGWLQAGPVVFVNGRWLPPAGHRLDAGTPHVGTVGDEVAYAVVPSPTAGDWPDAWKASLPGREVGGKVVRHLWELVDANAEWICNDFATLTRNSVPARLDVVGSREHLWVDPSATIDPMVVADTTKGPVVIQAGAVISAFTRLEGPCCIGPGTHVMGAKVRAGTTLGPNCRVGGEVEASIIQGNSNKYHDGFLGHSYVGEWVNLGAGTSNSDLRNDYCEVTVTVNGQRVPTGRTKVGCFLGDHTKAGLGTLLNTGTNAGVFCNLLPSGGFLPKYVPSFCSWWNGSLTDRADLHALLKTAAKVMERRGAVFTEAHAEVVEALFDETAQERRRVLAEVEARRWRRRA